jgi:hypothetical protein
VAIDCGRIQKQSMYLEILLALLSARIIEWFLSAAVQTYNQYKLKQRDGDIPE